MEKITLIVVDDHPIFRQGVVDTLSLEDGFSIIAQAASGEEGLELIRSLQPQIAIIDVSLPEMNGQQVTRQVVEEKLPTRVILLTAYDDTEQKLHAMRVGAAAYCVKDVEPTSLVDIVHQVVKGNFVIGERVFDQAGLYAWLELNGGESLYSESVSSPQPLTSREMEVLNQMTRGLSNKEIAMELGISHQTVKNHVTAILRKLGVEDRTQAALYALRRGWVRVHEQDRESQE
ncbi:MAG: response regulator transcription factor [Anaerolineales bacterium]|nr:response regulator transcription factor [Anaerolineales bacterium]